MFAFLSDPDFLHALALSIGPLAFFAAPTEEIERMLMWHEEEAEFDTVIEIEGLQAANDDPVSLPEAA